MSDDIDCGYHDSPADKFWYDELNWCGCGRPNEIRAFFRDVLRAIANRSSAIKARPKNLGWMISTPEEELADVAWKALLPDESLLADAFLYILDEKGLTEHGGSIYGSWLSPAGIVALKALEDDGDAA